ncbi:MAG: AI-2E family transporter [Bacteroidota bacterium]
MYKKNKWVFIILILLLVGFLVWFFSNILIYILVAAILSIMGRPLVVLFDRIKFGKRKFPHILSSIFALLVIYGLIIGFFSFIVPMLVYQIASLTSMNPELLTNSLKGPIDWIENILITNQIILSSENLEALFTTKIMSFVNITNISGLADTLIGFTGSLFIAIFAIGFITFFFLKEDRMLIKGIMLLTPVRLQSEIKHVYLKTIKMLSKYFLGLCLDLFIVITLITISTWFFGFKNALMIGFFAGIMNIVPYVGPIIGWVLAMFFAVTGIIDSGQTIDLMPVFLKITGTLITVNILDAFFLQPMIYSNVVKAHPLEIFLVILIAGSAAGISGMILAIPTYTVIRIIAKEFMNKSALVKKITQNI